MFGFENGLIYPAYVSNETFEDYMDLLLITDDKKLHYVYIKEFNKFMYSKTKHKNEKHFRRYFLHCFSSKKILATHKNIHSLFLAVLLTKLCVLMINLANRLFFIEEKMQPTGSLKQYLKSIGIVDQLSKIPLTKNLS